ncbi:MULTISPECIES: hypothetical protein [unclassified Microbulbifer]|uniref:hypothetical protein n=1 Tax=unclassified Microbulbifer TaxID=2619833 RepID=UPI0027E5B01F|nr:MULTISPECIES: hypothetical protein [unclassified Microbulbifer]
MPHILKITFGAAALALGLSTTALAQSDREVYEYAIKRAARICPAYSKENTPPVIKAAPVGALRVLEDRGYVICPDLRLEADAPAVWYGNVGVFVWNPKVDGAGEVIVAKVDAMTRSEAFPVEIVVWDKQGERMENQTVPKFEARPGASLPSKR